MMKGILLYCSMNAFFTEQIIEEARKKANMTQAKLAEKIGTNKSYISRVETGKTEPKVSTFYRIASALGLNVCLLYTSPSPRDS